MDITAYLLARQFTQGKFELLSNATTYIGVTVTELTEGCTTNPIIIGGTAVTAVAGNVAVYGEKKFAYTGAIWQECGIVGAEDLDQLKINEKLLHDAIPGTVQTYDYTNGAVSQITHAAGGQTVRTDAFTYTDAAVTEVRTLSTGETITFVTDLSTLKTTVTYAGS